jgi:iron complex outermembrane receptor protein
MLVQLREHSLSWMFAAAMLLRCASALPGQSDGAERIHFAIDKGALTPVLRQFSQQADLQITADAAAIESTTDEIGPFYGDATPTEALAELLRGTELSYGWFDAKTLSVTVIRPPHSEGDVHEVVVTGTRLSGEGPAPVRVYGRERIERLGISSTSDLSSYITQQPFAFTGAYLQNSAQFFQMRGLGFDTTLVLINGRRVPPSANSISLNAVDVNNIPLMAVERTEVMSDSASAIYGADAIGGVVNVILKDQIAQPELYFHFGQADGGGTQRRVSGSFGETTARMKSMLVLDYYETDVLMGSERELWRNQDFRRFGGRDYRATEANPGNVYSLTGAPLPGLPTSQAAVPSGATVGLTPADFLPTAGVVNRASQFSDYSITPLSQRLSAYGSAEYSFDRLVLFEEFLVANNELTVVRGLPSVYREIVPASNPYNPFGTPVAVDYSFAGMDPISYRYQTRLARLVVGARGGIGAWDWEITGLRHQESGTTASQGTLDLARVRGAIRSTNPATALNLFTDGPPASEELLDSLATATQSLTFWCASAQLSAFMRGPLFHIGAQNAELVVGGEWRHDAALFTESGRPVDADRDIASVFSEIRLPLLSELTLKIAARGDDYGGGKQVLNPLYGLTWRPTDEWLFRAAYGTSFRPPSLFESSVPLRGLALIVSDPRRGGTLSYVDVLLGGNPDLELVTAHSFTTGFVFTPAWASKLRLQANYWRVRMDDRIMAPTSMAVLSSESELVGRVTRNDPNEEDLQMGWPGSMRLIDLTPVNYGDLETSGVDLGASLSIDRSWGRWNLNVETTWVDEYSSRDMNPALPRSRVGIANMQGTIPESRTIGTVGFEHGRYGVSTTATYVPAYRDSDLQGPLDRYISAQLLVDLQASVNLEGNDLIEGSTVTIGARNLFDREPDFANVGMSLGYDISQTELTRRFIYLRVGKRF